MPKTARSVHGAAISIQYWLETDTPTDRQTDSMYRACLALHSKSCNMKTTDWRWNKKLCYCTGTARRACQYRNLATAKHPSKSDLQTHSRSLAVMPFDRPYMILYLSSTVTMSLSCTVFEILSLNSLNLQTLHDRDHAHSRDSYCNPNAKSQHGEPVYEILSLIANSSICIFYFHTADYPGQPIVVRLCTLSTFWLAYLFQ